MKKYSAWFITLFALAFIAVPGIVGIYFMVNENYNYGIVFGAAFGILVGGFIITFLGMKAQLFGIEAFTFIMPLSIVFFGLFATMYSPWWAMVIVALVGILSSFPINIIVTKIKDAKRAKALEKAKLSKRSK